MVHSQGAMILGLGVACLAASAGGVGYSIRVARRKGIMDVPNARSSHQVPTPRIGGIPMAAAAVLAFACWVWIGDGVSLYLKGAPDTILFAMAISALGFRDDLSALSPLSRFLVQVACAALILAGSARLVPILVQRTPLLLTALWALVAVVWIVWMVNLYNFMDGIDGLAGGEALLASLFFAVVFARYGEFGWAAANLFLAAAAAGFLVFNWPPARVFMGDAGSGFLGAFFAMQSVLAALTTPLPFVVLVLPLANFILDTTATLLRRMSRGEKWYLAHRSHLYQRMTNLGMSHRKVTTLELSYAAACCLAAFRYLRLGPAGKAAVVAAAVAAFSAGAVWVAGKQARQSSD